jgi:hypothetical protein
MFEARKMQCRERYRPLRLQLMEYADHPYDTFKPSWFPRWYRINKQRSFAWFRRLELSAWLNSDKRIRAFLIDPDRNALYDPDIARLQRKIARVRLWGPRDRDDVYLLDAITRIPLPELPRQPLPPGDQWL